MVNGHQNTLASWRTQLLQKYDLSFPDGRSLHQYDVSDEEFVTLQNAIRNTLSDVSELDGYFSAAFVIYAAEWWRRNYQGGLYKWEPIIASFGGSFRRWNNAVRKRHVIKGLESWKLELNENGHRYLGSIAVQGGIPSSVFERESGKIANLLFRVVARARKQIVNLHFLEGWVYELQDMLPKTYQQESIRKLLAGFALEAIEIGSFLTQHKGRDALEVLDRERPNWRRNFPVSIRDKASRRFVDSFVKKVAKGEVKRRPKSERLVRRLKEGAQGNWELYSEYHIEDEPSIASLENLFPDFKSQHSKKGTHPRTLLFEFRALETIQRGELHKLVGPLNYRFSKTSSWGNTGVLASMEHSAKLISKDGQGWQAMLPHGEELDDLLPWFFVEDEEGFRFVREGSGTLSSEEVLLVIPKDWSIDDVSNEAYFDIPSIGRKAFIVVGNVQIHAGRNRFHLQTGHQGSDEDSHYEWMGKREWADCRPTMIFKGEPSLYRVKEDGSRRPIDRYKVKAEPKNSLGPVVLEFKDRNALVFRSRMILIADDATISFIHKSRTHGQVLFSGWGANRVEADVGFENHVNGDEVVVDLKLDAGARVPAFVTLEVHWAHSEKTAKIRIPFPAVGAIAFDEYERPLENKSRLSIHRLLGKRLHVFRKSPRDKVEVELGIRNIFLKRVFTISKSSKGFDEIRLNDYRNEIERLLCASESLDDDVRFRIFVDGKMEYELSILPYDISLDFDESKEHVFLEPTELMQIGKEDIAGLEALALRFQYPDDEPERLPTAIGAEHKMKAPSLDPGAWLIYPSTESTVRFRPTLKFVNGETNACTPLTRASDIPVEFDRYIALDAAIGSMANDYTHADWTVLQTIYDKLGYLPLPIHDIWKRFARSPDAMAALAFRSGNIPFKFAMRFTKELPFAWEMIPVASWTKALNSLHQQCRRKYPGEGDAFFRMQTKDRIESLQKNVPALKFLLGIVSAHFFEGQELQLVEYLKSFGRNDAQTELFAGESSCLMALRRGHAKDSEKWPSYPEASAVDEAKDQAHILRYLYIRSDIAGFERDVVNLPLWLAAKVAANETDDVFASPENIHTWRVFYDFDDEWFNEAFNLTIARCLADGVFDV